MITTTVPPEGRQRLANQPVVVTKSPLEQFEALEAQVQPVPVSNEILLEMMRAKKLIPGQMYRITDFITHGDAFAAADQEQPLDILVMATDATTISETALAMKHDGDSHFNAANVQGWQLGFTPTIDTARFPDADPLWKGLVYYVKYADGTEKTVEGYEVGGGSDYVSYAEAQTLTDAQKQQARENIDAISLEDIPQTFLVCSSAASTVAKTITAPDFVLVEGKTFSVRMVNANSASNPTLNINSTGAKAIYYNGAQASSSNTWDANDVLEVYYDGTQYQCASGGGGKFATGEKVKDVSITNTLNNTSALVESQTVFLPVKNLNDTVFGTEEETITIPRTKIFKPNNVVFVDIDYIGVIKNGDRIQFSGTNGYVCKVGIINSAGTAYEKLYTDDYVSSLDIIYNDGDGRNIRFIVKRSDNVNASIQDVENNTDESITRTVLSGGLERRVENLENKKPTIKALFIGNSVCQDHVAYLPWLLKNIYNDSIDFEIYLAYKGGATIKYYVDNIITGDVPVEIFSHAKNKAEWTNTNNFAYADIWTSYGPFDLICYEGYFNHGSSSAGNVEDTSSFMTFVNDLKTRQTEPFKLGYLIHQTYTTSSHTEADAWTRIVNGAIFAIENTPVSILFPCGVVTKLVNGEIPQSTLTNDNIHNQQGLPCIMGAYTLVEKLSRYVGLPSMILNNPLRITQGIETSLNIPGPNGTLQVGTEQQYSLCQDAAVKAVKYSDWLMIENSDIFNNP